MPVYTEAYISHQLFIEHCLVGAQLIQSLLYVCAPHYIAVVLGCGRILWVVACVPIAQEKHVSRGYKLLSRIFHKIRLARCVSTFAVRSCRIIAYRQLVCPVMYTIQLHWVASHRHFMYNQCIHIHVPCEGDDGGGHCRQCGPRTAGDRC